MFEQAGLFSVFDEATSSGFLDIQALATGYACSTGCGSRSSPRDRSGLPLIMAYFCAGVG